jgi:hypothetical protein
MEAITGIRVILHLSAPHEGWKDANGIVVKDTQAL